MMNQIGSESLWNGPMVYRDDDIIGKFAGSPLGYQSCKNDDVDLSIDSLHGFMPSHQPAKMSPEQELVDQYLEETNWLSNSNGIVNNDMFDLASFFSAEDKQKKVARQVCTEHPSFFC